MTSAVLLLHSKGCFDIHISWPHKGLVEHNRFYLIDVCMFILCMTTCYTGLENRHAFKYAARPNENAFVCCGVGKTAKSRQSQSLSYDKIMYLAHILILSEYYLMFHAFLVPAQHRKWFSDWLMTQFIYFSCVISRLSLIHAPLQWKAIQADGEKGWQISP